MKRCLIAYLLVFAMLFTLVGCAGPKSEEVVPEVAEPEVDTSEPVTLRIVGPWYDFAAMDAVADLFIKEYGNCTIEYEYLQDYYESLEKRLSADSDSVDIFVTVNIQSDSALLPYAMDMYTSSIIDFSDAFDGLIHNFEFRSTDDSAARQIYAVPFGAEVRGMYVNKTLLQSLGLDVPENSEELLHACAVLKENGYVPFQGNPGSFAQQLMYPYCANLIANADDYEAAYNTVSSREAGVSELFREPMSLLYTLMSERYYDYKRVEAESGFFTDSTNEAYARCFLNIVDDNGTFVKADDVGTVAFMPSTMGIEGIIEKTKSDYHSEIEYEFMLSPVGDNGGYAYMSPAHGIGINKNSSNLEWAERFINFLFEDEVNKVFAEEHSVIPNTSDAFEYIEKRFSIPEENISQLGEVTFDYGFYALIVESLTEVAKGNNPKYMTTDASGAPALYDLEYYMERLELRLTDQMPEEE